MSASVDRALATPAGTSPRVIGTAGHVDHGKSTLIRALTGIDPDRLEEEKARGMTIDLGFAWLRLPSGQEVSVVDVPGHERFIKNMLAGVGGIDIALLVIAADEGVMPQTREHLAILDLLGIDSAVVALTKADLVDDEDWLALVRKEVEEILAGTTLAGAPIIAVSSTTGAGVDGLLAELDHRLQTERRRRQTGWPRLPVDRVFTMAGFGTVVTGTLVDGEIHVGQDVEILPSTRRGRVRGLQSHRRRVDAARAGSRVAVNISGISVEEVERGEVVTTPGWLTPTRVVDVRLRVVHDAPRALAHNARITFHTGAAEASGRVALLDRADLTPGEAGWAQIRLDREVAVVKGDSFIIRLPSPSATIGGGAIVDEHPKRHRRYQERVLNQLEILAKGTPEEVLVQTLQGHEPLELGDLARRTARTVSEAAALVSPLLRKGAVVAVDLLATSHEGGAKANPLPPAVLLFSAQGWARLRALTSQTLEAYHMEHRLRRGMPREELRMRLGYEPRAYGRIERELSAHGDVSQDGPVVRLPSFAVRLSPLEEGQARDLLADLARGGIAVPGRAQLISRHSVADEVIQALVDRGDLVEVGAELVYPTATYEDLVRRVRELVQARGSVTVADARDAFATSRKYALALLEHLDERKVTRRDGDQRTLL